MRHPFLLIIIAISSCSKTEERKKYVSMDTAQTSALKPHLKANGKRPKSDSITTERYQLNGGWVEATIYKAKKLEHWREFYANGQVKEEGLISNSNHIYIGVWKYYSSNGNLDSTVNYDTKHNISYFKALEIAKERGFEMPSMEVDLTFDKKKSYWEIIRWTEDSSRTGQTSEVILIDTRNGKVSIPWIKPFKIY